MVVTLYTRPGCHLCDQLKDDLAALRQIAPFELLERNIEDELILLERFRYLIPVLDIEDGRLLYPPHDWTTLLSALQTAQSQRHDA